MREMMHDIDLEVLDAPRIEEFTAIFGGPIVPVKSPIPTWTTLGNDTSETLVYVLDFRALEPGQKARLVAHLATKFEAPAAAVLAQLNERGLPIVAGNTIVNIKHPQQWW